ncbi:hypothetical protein D3C75_976170 [compost metagenome]
MPPIIGQVFCNRLATMAKIRPNPLSNKKIPTTILIAAPEAKGLNRQKRPPNNSSSEMINSGVRCFFRLCSSMFNE